MARVSRLAAAIAAVVTIAGLTFGTAAAQSPAAGKKVVWTYGSTNDVDSLNPFVGVEAPAYFTYFTSYDLLVNQAVKDLQPAPGLADSWEQSEAGKLWTFHLHPGVKWSDGEPLTANDVTYTYNRILEEQQGNYIDYLSLIDTVEAPDDATVVVTLKEPSTLILNQLALVYILPEHVWTDVSKKESRTFENCCPVVGSGPFVTVEWEKGQFIRMERNPNYWGPKPAVDEVIYRIFNNDDAVIQALKAGEIDYTDGVKAALFNSIKSDPSIGTQIAQIPSFDEIGMNSGADETIPDSDGHPALKDEVVRQAINYAIDRQELVDKILLGYGEPGTTIVPPFSAAYHWDPPPEETYTYDPEKANQLLDDAGYEDTDGDGIREMPGGGQPLTFRYFTRSENSDTVKASQFITGWLKDIGIGTKVQALTDTKLTDVLYEGNYDIFHWGWFPDPDPDFILSIMTCGQRPPKGVWSDSFYCNPEYDQMYQDQKVATDPQERIDIIQQMQQMVYEDAPYAVLFYDANLEAYRKDRWTGFQIQPAKTGDLLAGYGYQTFLTLRPVSATAGSTGTKGIPAAVWIGIVVAAIVVIGLVMLFRRRVGAEERE